MRRIRVTIGMLMAVVGLSGVQFAAARLLEETDQPMGWLALPVVTVLGLCAIVVARDIARFGETAAFLTGFGIAAASIFCLATQFEPIYRRAFFVVYAELTRLFGDPPSSNYAILLLSVLVCILPILLLAVLGGLLASASGLTLTIGKRSLISRRIGKKSQGDKKGQDQWEYKREDEPLIG